MQDDPVPMGGSGKDEEDAGESQKQDTPKPFSIRRKDKKPGKKNKKRR